MSLSCLFLGGFGVVFTSPEGSARGRYWANKKHDKHEMTGMMMMRWQFLFVQRPLPVVARINYSNRCDA
jgi:hypothetical protein